MQTPTQQQKAKHTGFRTLLALAGIAVIGAAGCDAGSFITSADPSEFPVDVTVNLAQHAVTGLSVEVTGPGIDQPIIANLPISGDVATGQVRVLSGSDRAFTVRAFDIQSMETHRGADTVDITADGLQSVDVALAPLTGDVDLSATVGSYTLTVSVPSATVAIAGTLQATVTVVDAAGNTIPSPQVVWASSNPSVASVTADGLITGLVAGQSSIGAAYEGFAGSVAITVQ